MKAELVISFEFDRYADVDKIVSEAETALGERIKSISIIFYDTADKPFMTETGITKP